MRPDRRARGGFSLLEVLVAVALVSIVAGAVAPLAVRQMNATRRERALEEMRRLVQGLVGRPAADGFGYVGDMGELPARLVDLNVAGSQSLRQPAGADGVAYGWSGPYAPSLPVTGGEIVDPWGRPYFYDGVDARVRSRGPDRELDTPDDLAWPPYPPRLAGDLAVSVVGIPGGDEAAVLLDSTQVEVRLAESEAGRRTERVVGGAGPFVAGDVHIGHHGVIAEGRGEYAGASVLDVVRIQPGTNSLRMALVRP